MFPNIRNIYFPMRAQTFISTAEAAFVGRLTDRQINRIVDEHLVPPWLLSQTGNSRSFARLTAAFARFYIDMENTLAAGARRYVVDTLCKRVSDLELDQRQVVLRLADLPKNLDWSVTMPNVVVDIAPYVADAYTRAKEIDRADSLVAIDPETMSGAPSFAGTRVPIEVVLASLDEGVSMERLKASYPFLTDAHVEAARTYAAVHPRRGRPRKLMEHHPTLRERSSKVVRPTRR
ncbi:DUF433 domain-containing protein [Rudaea sp.]|uniref:DUF433 domain-containing protein n=1 Tax=Rudaea sp. TaxID=2136325 RepID=UPI0037835BF3